METLLSDCRVLDLCDEKGIACGRVLADLGADVIKIERPGGDPCRNIGPFYHDTPDSERSLFWFAYNVNKRGVTLNIECADGREIFEALVKTADVVVESYAPGYMDGLGLGYTDLSQINRRIIMTSISAFGQTGPYRGYQISDLVAGALGGYLYLCGDPDRAPVRISAPQAYAIAGYDAAWGAIAAYYYQQKSGTGQHVDVSIQEAVSISHSNAVAYYTLHKYILKRAGQLRTRVGGRRVSSRQIWPCKNGFLCFNVGGGAQHAMSNRALVAWLEGEGLADDFVKSVEWESFDMASVEQDYLDHIERVFERFFSTHTKEELYAGGIERRIDLYPVADTKEIFQDRQLKERDFWVTLEHAELSDSIMYPGVCVRFSEATCGIRSRAPLIGEHNEEIYLNELGMKQEDILRYKCIGAI